MNFTAEIVASVLAAEWNTKISQDMNLNGIRFEPFSGTKPMLVVLWAGGNLGVSSQWVAKNDSLVAATLGTPGAVPVEGIPHLKVANVETALNTLAIHARSKIGGKFFSVVGSVGKTTTTSMLAHVLRKEFGTRKVFILANGNIPPYIAVDLVSAPSNADFYLLEMAGASSMGTRPFAEASAELTRPHSCIFTALSPAHMDKMQTLENAAFRKASAFSYIARGGNAVINHDMAYFEVAAARVPRGVDLITFGSQASSDVRLKNYDAATGVVQASVCGEHCEYTLGGQGIHLAMNSLGVIASLAASGLDWKALSAHLYSWQPLPGRGRLFAVPFAGGEVTVIDEAYNANPGSMRAALENLHDRTEAARRIAVLGEMRELGDREEEYHYEMLESLRGTDIKVYVIGGNWKRLWEDLPASQQGAFTETIADMEKCLAQDLKSGDAVMFKGSYGSKTYELVQWISAANEL